MDLQTQRIEQAFINKKEVYFEGSTDIKQGQGLCYNSDYGTAASEDPSRLKRAELPDTTNGHAFAGNALFDYPGKVGGRRIEVAEPGGYGYALSGADSTVDATFLTCSCSTGVQGWYIVNGLMGRGTVRLLKTTTASTLFSSLDGSATYTNSSKTISKTNCGVGAVAGDKVMVVGGNDDDTDTQALTFGEYIIDSRTDDTIVLTTAIGGDAAGLHFIVVDVAETTAVPCYLYDGEESGLLEFLSPLDNAATQSMVGGMTVLCGGYDITNGVTSVLADGTYTGARKAFVVAGTLGVADYVLTTTSGIQGDGVSALANLTFDGDTEMALLEWFESEWLCKITTAAVA